MGIFTKGDKPFKLITAYVNFTDSNVFHITYRKHSNEIQSPELIRLILHYYAKILYNSDPDSDDGRVASKLLISIMDSIWQQPLEKDSDIFALADISDVASLTMCKPRGKLKTITATLFYVDQLRRQIVTELPKEITYQQTVFSVIALLKSNLMRLDKESILILKSALGFMNYKYNEGLDYADINNMADIPNRAYLSLIYSMMEDRLNKKE